MNWLKNLVSPVPQFDTAARKLLIDVPYRTRFATPKKGAERSFFGDIAHAVKPAKKAAPVKAK